MITIKKFVLKLDLNDVRDKRKALKIVSSQQGIDSIAMDMGEMKLTVIGMADPITIVIKLRKYWTTDLISVGPAKEAEKPEEPIKEEEPKTEDAKKEEPKKEEDEKKEVKKEDEKDAEPKNEKEKEKEEEEDIVDMMSYHQPYMPYHYHYQYQHRSYYPSANTYYYQVQQNAEENSDSCVIS